jgi:hypothetical protein
MFGDSNL